MKYNNNRANIFFWCLTLFSISVVGIMLSYILRIFL
jgi:hypothetical protein